LNHDVRNTRSGANFAALRSQIGCKRERQMVHAAFHRPVDVYGEDAVATMTNGLSRRIHHGESRRRNRNSVT
jgi:hypothetical protein